MGQKGKYKAAIIGCGRIGSEFDDDPLMRKIYGIASHAGAYTDNPQIDLIAATDIDEEKRINFGRRWNVDNLYADYEDMLEKEDIDILSICTPNSTHLEIFEKSVKASVKAIFCEKPVSDSLENAEKMVDTAKKNNIIFVVNHRRRWDGLYRDVREFINGGGLGAVQHVSCYYNTGIANTGCHMLDVLRMFLGEAKTVTARYKGNPDILDPDIDGHIIFDNDVSVSLQSMDIKNYLIFEFDIYGSAGRLRIEHNGFQLSYWKATESQRYQGLKELIPGKCPIILSEPAMFKNSLMDIIDCLETQKQSACTGEDGVKALEIISALHMSAKAGGSEVNLPLKDRAFIIKSK